MLCCYKKANRTPGIAASKYQYYQNIIDDKLINFWGLLLGFGDGSCYLERLSSKERGTISGAEKSSLVGLESDTSNATPKIRFLIIELKFV